MAPATGLAVGKIHTPGVYRHTPTIYCVHETCFRGNQIVSTGTTPTPTSSSNNLLNNPTIFPTPTKITFRHLLDELFMSIQLGNIRPTPTPP